MRVAQTGAMQGESAGGTITVTYWAAAREAIGLSSEQFPVCADIPALRELIEQRHPQPQIASLLSRCRWIATPPTAAATGSPDRLPPRSVDPLARDSVNLLEPGSCVDVLPPYAGGAEMRSVGEHLELILGSAVAMAAEQVSLAGALGRVAARSVEAAWPLPNFANSAMDGYAVRSVDLLGASQWNPIELSVVADIGAGASPSVELAAGQAARIMTGAPIPAGADAVVPVEQTNGNMRPDLLSDRVSVVLAPPTGRNIRPAGEDVQPGQRVLEPGHAITSRDIALVAAAGANEISVRSRPRVTLISTGVELVEPGQAPGPAHIVDSNSAMLAAAVEEAGAQPRVIGPVPDDPQVIAELVERESAQADVIVTTGGVSAGAYDAVKQAFANAADIGFTSVAMRPGKPQGFGRIGDRNIPLLMFPGNAVSAYVSFVVFAVPLIRAMTGQDPKPMLFRARTTQPIATPPGLRTYVRCSAAFAGSTLTVTPLAGHGSHQLSSLAKAQALAVVDEDVVSVLAGDDVTVIMLPSQHS